MGLIVKGPPSQGVCFTTIYMAQLPNVVAFFPGLGEWSSALSSLMAAASARPPGSCEEHLGGLAEIWIFVHGEIGKFSSGSEPMTDPWDWNSYCTYIYHRFFTQFIGKYCIHGSIWEI